MLWFFVFFFFLFGLTWFHSFAFLLSPAFHTISTNALYSISFISAIYFSGKNSEGLGYVLCPLRNSACTHTRIAALAIHQLKYIDMRVNKSEYKVSIQISWLLAMPPRAFLL